MTKCETSMARVIAAVVTLLFASVEARAQATADDVVAKVTQLNKDAVTAYQAKKYEDARKILKQALDLAESSGLEQHPITARTHVHLGIVIIAGFKQRDLGIKQFKKALEIQPNINLTKALVTPELTAAFAEAKGSASAGPAPAVATTPAPVATSPPAAAPAPAAKPTPPTPAAAAPAPAATSPAPTEPPATENPTTQATTPPPSEAAPEVPSTGLVHEPVTEGKKGSAISITVGTQSDLKFAKMILAYRPEGASEFLGREMRAVAEGRYGAEIPTTATLGASVAYYVEADDGDGNPVAARGSVDSPLVIKLAGPHVAVRRPAADEEEEEQGPDHRYFVALLVGTGFGWATGVGDTNHDVMISPAGIATASLGQIAPEVGYWLRSSLMLSLQLRYQHVTGTTDVYDQGVDHHTANYAFAAFAKATWKWGEGKLHPLFSLALGGGEIRHVVTLKHVPLINGVTECGSSMNETCVDTIAAGPIMLGPGGGILYDLTDKLSLVAQGNSVIAFPNFTFNVDINVGVAYGF
jgi:hypothetical protein